ncbi:MAG: nucleoside phosphorylase [Acidimicrobiia bacterium]
MPFPNFDGKHAHDAMVNPEDLLRWRIERGLIAQDVRVPEAVIVTYQPLLWEAAAGAEATSECAASPTASLRTLDTTEGQVGVLGKFGFGAPIAAILIEELICLGVTRFLSIGAAGSLQQSLAVGEIVLCEAAVRDEGVSHHYLPPATHSTPSPSLTAALERELAAGRGLHFRRGSSWTVDAPYRETVEEARHYQAQGVDCVEMEAAAVFAVGEHRGVDVAAAVCISDLLGELEWEPQFDSEDLVLGMWGLYQAARRCLIATLEL